MSNICLDCKHLDWLIDSDGDETPFCDKNVEECYTLLTECKYFETIFKKG